MRLVFKGVSIIREAVQEVGRCNCPPLLRNQLLPKTVQAALGVLGVSNPVPVELKDFDAMEGWILESRIDCQGGTEVCPLLIQPLMSRILSSTRLHSFLLNMEIVQ